MPKVAKIPKVKKFTLIYDFITYTFTLGLHATSSAIMLEIRRAIRPRSDIYIADASGRHLRLTYHDIKHNATLYAHNKAKTDGDNSNREGLQAKDKIPDILRSWNLDNASQIFPADIAPRIPLRNGTKPTFNDEEQQIQNPGEWSQKFVMELWKLSRDAAHAYKEALDIVVEVVRGRYVDKKNAHRGVVEVMTSDLKKATELRGERVKALVDVAEEALGVGTYVLGLSEAIHEVEREVQVEDGVALKNWSLDD